MEVNAIQTQGNKETNFLQQQKKKIENKMYLYFVHVDLTNALGT